MVVLLRLGLELIHISLLLLQLLLWLQRLKLFCFLTCVQLVRVFANILQDLSTLMGLLLPTRYVVVRLLVLQTPQNRLVLHCYLKEFSLPYIFIQASLHSTALPLVPTIADHDHTHWLLKLYSSCTALVRVVQSPVPIMVHYVCHFLQKNAVFTFYFSVSVYLFIYWYRSR